MARPTFIPTRVAAPPDEPERLPRPFGPYTLVDLLATGGVAELFLALDRTRTPLVIKRLLPSVRDRPEFIAILMNEGRVAGSLDHPNLVRLREVGEVGEAREPYLALEYVAGADVRAVVRQMKKRDVTEFPRAQAVAIALGVCSGLAHLHTATDRDAARTSIVHRDVAPPNVLVAFDGTVKLADFGLAQPAASAGKRGVIEGNVPYMSPEQARGEELDGRSDLFALGTMLFELTTGRRLFRGKSEYETLRLICDREYPAPSEVARDYPPELERIVMRALSKDRATRYPSADAMRADLEGFAAAARIDASPDGLARFMESIFAEAPALAAAR